MSGRIRGATGNPPTGAIPTEYMHVEGDSAVRAEIQNLLNRGQSARQIMVHLTEHGQYPEGDIKTMLTSIQTLLPRQTGLIPSQEIVLPLNAHLAQAGIRYVTALLSCAKYGASPGQITQIFHSYNYPASVVGIIDQQISLLRQARTVHYGPTDLWYVGTMIELSTRFRSQIHNGEYYTEGIVMAKAQDNGVVSYTIQTAPHNSFAGALHTTHTTGDPSAYGHEIFRNQYVLPDQTLAIGNSFGGTTSHPPPGIPYGHAGHQYTSFEQALLDRNVERLMSDAGDTPEELAHEEDRVRTRYARLNVDPVQVTRALAAATAARAARDAAPPVVVPAAVVPAAVVPAARPTNDLMGANEDPHTFAATYPTNQWTALYGRPNHIYNSLGTPTEIRRVVAELVAVPHTDMEVRRMMLGLNLGPPSVVTDALRRARVALPGSGVVVQAAAPPPAEAIPVGTIAPVTGTTTDSSRRLLAIVPPFATWVAAQDTRLRDELGPPPTDPVLEARWVTRARAIFNAENDNAATPDETPAHAQVEGQPAQPAETGPAETCPDRRRLTGGAFGDPTKGTRDWSFGGRPGCELEGFGSGSAGEGLPEKKAEGGGSGAVLLAAAVAVGVLVAKFS